MRIFLSPLRKYIYIYISFAFFFLNITTMNPPPMSSFKSLFKWRVPSLISLTPPKEMEGVTAGCVPINRTMIFCRLVLEFFLFCFHLN